MAVHDRRVHGNLTATQNLITALLKAAPQMAPRLLKPPPCTQEPSA